MLSPSWIHRSEDLVGIVTPTSPPAAAAAPDGAAAGAWSTVFSLDPQAARAVASTTLPARVASRASFMVFSPLSRAGSRPSERRTGSCGVSSAPAGQAGGQPVVGLVPPQAVGEGGGRAVGVDHQQLG